MRFIVCIVLSVILLQCGTSDRLTGGSSTAGNGVVVGKVHSAAGRPVADASVYLYRKEGVLSADAATDSTLSGDNGTFTFDDVTPGDYSIFAKVQKEEVLSALSDVAVARDEEVTVDPMILSKSGIITGTLGFDIDSSWTVFASVEGTPLNDTLDNAFSFSIASVPSGRYSLVVFAFTPASGELNCIASDSVSIVDGIMEKQPILDRFTVVDDGVDTLLLDSFDDENKLLLNNRTNWWHYTGGNSEQYETTTVAVDFNSSEGWDGTGSCAHVEVTFDADNAEAFAGFGCMIDNEVLGYHNLYSLENMSEIRFRMRGTGLECDVVLFSPANNTYNVLKVIDPVPEEWTPVTIDIATAVEALDDDRRDKWIASVNSIEQMTFNFYKLDHNIVQADFFIDDVVFIFNR